jgi:hypothetical protein
MDRVGDGARTFGSSATGPDPAAVAQSLQAPAAAGTADHPPPTGGRGALVLEDFDHRVAQLDLTFVCDRPRSW